jgi:hypothetical protein
VSDEERFVSEEEAALEGSACCNYFRTECAGPCAYRTYGGNWQMSYYLCERHYQQYLPDGPAGFPEEPLADPPPEGDRVWCSCYWPQLCSGTPWGTPLCVCGGEIESMPPGVSPEYIEGVKRALGAGDGDPTIISDSGSDKDWEIRSSSKVRPS